MASGESTFLPAQLATAFGNAWAIASLAPMQSNEVLARRIVGAVGHATADHPSGWVMLHQVVQHLKVDEASAEAAMRVAIASRWLNAEGCSLYRICLTPAGRALPLPDLMAPIPRSDAEN
jgi:hypothetical protein